MVSGAAKLCPTILQMNDDICEGVAQPNTSHQIGGVRKQYEYV
jgi:hypothetical protein